MKVKPWMVGVGVLGGMAGIVVIYEVVQSKKAAAPPDPGAVDAAIAKINNISQSVVPTLAVTRPAVPAGPAFGSGGWPMGAVLTMAPGTQAAAVGAGQNITLVLPTGGKWIGIVAGNSANSSTATGLVDFGNDLTSPVSFTIHSLVGANILMAVWTDSKGAKQYTYVTFPMVVAPRALHFGV